MRVGIVGAGQLGRMLAQAGSRLGMQFNFLDPSHEACAAEFGKLICTTYGDAEGLFQLAEQSDFITFEFENVPPRAVERLAMQTPTQPGALALATARDRWAEKTLFQQLDIPVAEVRKVDSQEELAAVVAKLGLPLICKTRTLGYDGKGQKRLLQESDLANTFSELGEVPLIAERMVNFSQEVSIIAVRNHEGEVRCYPLAINEHRRGILHSSTPAPEHPLNSMAQSYIMATMDALHYVGVMAFEFFAVDDQLLANEIAPRVHNSGHWSIEGSECSQFENHLRALCDLPLGSTLSREPSCLLNLIGARPDYQALLAIPGVHLHDYGKQARPGRKIGHITLTASNSALLNERRHQVEELLVNDLGDL